MRPATLPPAVRDDVRLLAVDREGGRLEDHQLAALPELLDPEDLLVLNDAATLPASLRASDGHGRSLEIRLLANTGALRWQVVLFGEGDWRTRTEDRDAPPPLGVGASILLGGIEATVVSVSSVSPRLVELQLAGDEASVLRALYDHGRPVQYAYLQRDLELWSVQTTFASRPWAVEMPSAGRPLSWQLLLALRRRGVELATLTHAAGLSATGDPALDAALPLAERYELPAQTVDAIARGKARGGRIIAVGTTVVRALEGCAAAHDGSLQPGTGKTDLILDEHHALKVVDGLLTGMHEPTESHFRLLRAFAPQTLLDRALKHAIAQGYRTHEFGDVTLLA